jgi:C4-dicarboxylate transporter
MQAQSTAPLIATLWYFCLVSNPVAAAAALGVLLVLVLFPVQRCYW